MGNDQPCELYLGWNRDDYLAHRREYYQENKARLRVAACESYLRNKTKVNTHCHEYYEAHKAEILEQQHQYYLARKEEKIAHVHSYREKNKDIVANGLREYRANHKDEIRKWKHTDYLEKTNEYKARFHRFRTTHHEYMVKLRKKRALLEKQAGNMFTSVEFALLCMVHNYKCVYCGEEKELVPDHVVPLSRGGTNCIGNILPACNKCNSEKHTLTYDEFMDRLATGRNAKGGYIQGG